MSVSVNVGMVMGCLGIFSFMSVLLMFSRFRYWLRFKLVEMVFRIRLKLLCSLWKVFGLVVV